MIQVICFTIIYKKNIIKKLFKKTKQFEKNILYIKVYILYKNAFDLIYQKLNFFFISCLLQLYLKSLKIVTNFKYKNTTHFTMNVKCFFKEHNLYILSLIQNSSFRTIFVKNIK